MISILHLFFHQAISCTAPSGAEAFSPACFRLYDFLPAYGTAPILLTPDRIVQPRQFTGTGKTVCFAKKLDLIDLQAQLIRDQPVTDAMHPHCPDLFFLRFRHMLSPRNRRCFAVYGIHTGYAKAA